MTTFLIVTQIVLAIIVTIVVLFQKSSSIGLGAYSGTNESIFGAKGATPFLSKMTFLFGFLFVVNTVILGYIYNKAQSKTVLDTVSIVPQVEMPKVITPAQNELNNSTITIDEALKNEPKQIQTNETNVSLTTTAPTTETKSEINLTTTSDATPTESNETAK